MKRVGFRGRLFLILLAFALIPSILISLAWSTTGSFVLPLVGETTIPFVSYLNWVFSNGGFDNIHEKLLKRLQG